MGRYSRLRSALDLAFGTEDLAVLCHDAGVDFEQIPGLNRGRETIVLELVAYFDRRNKLPALVAACVHKRPNVDWQALYDQDRAERKQLASPYPGLQPYSEKQHALFFGRQSETAEILSKLLAQSFVLLLGASGSGKSSLINAGVLPRMQTDERFTPHAWQVRRITPDERADVALADESARHIASVAANPLARTLLIVDPLERIFGLPERDREVLNRFCASLLELCQRDDIVVLAAMRNDFLDALRQTRLWPLAETQRFIVTPPTGSRLREAIQKPAEALEITIAPELVERLVADALDQPGALPMVQLALQRLWAERHSDVIELADYEAFAAGGGNRLIAAFEHDADRAVSDPAGQRRQTARQIILDLVQLGIPGISADIKRRMSHAALRDGYAPDAEFDTVLQTLIAKHLIAFDNAGGASVELAHEALIDHWTRLRKWLSEYRDGLTQQRKLESAAALWRERVNDAQREFDPDDGTLWDGQLLEDTLHYMQNPVRPLTSTQNGFIAHCQAESANRQRERMRRLGGGLAVGLGLAAGSLITIAYIRNGVWSVPIAALLMVLFFPVGAGLGWLLGRGLWLARARMHWERVSGIGALAAAYVTVIASVAVGLWSFSETDWSGDAWFAPFARKVAALTLFGFALGCMTAFVEARRRWLWSTPLVLALAGIVLVEFYQGSWPTAIAAGAIAGSFLTLGMVAGSSSRGRRRLTHIKRERVAPTNALDDTSATDTHPTLGD